MLYSSYRFQYFSSIRRLLLQKHIRYFPDSINITLSAAHANLPAIEDIEVVNAVNGLTDIAGQSPCLLDFGSKYIGTVKRGLYRVILHLKKEKTFFFLEQLSLFFFPNLQKRNGLFSWSNGLDKFTICCNDLRLFTNYFSVTCESNVVITLETPVKNSTFLIDLFRLYKFDIK